MTNRPAAYHENEADEDEVQKNEQRAREAAEDKTRENELLRVQAKHFLEAQENERLRESELLRIQDQDDEDEARENELLRARPVQFLEAQENERLRAQDEDNAHHGFFTAERQDHYISKKDGLDKQVVERS